MSVTQFVKAALIGTDGEYVVLSPVVEGVDGASRTIFATEVGEEIKVEDDQTVFTSVKNTVTIIATVLDADITKINSWITNDIYVGFAGHTIGNIVSTVGVSNSVVFRQQLQLGNAISTASEVGGGNRGDSFQISAIQRVSEIKHTWRIVLTQICLQSSNPVNGVMYGVFPSTDLLKSASVSNVYSGSKTGTSVLPFNGVLAGVGDYINNTTLASNLSSITTTNTATGAFTSNFFFPFIKDVVLNGSGSASGGTQASAILYRYNGTGGLVSTNSVAIPTSAGAFAVTSVGTSDSVFLRMGIQKNSASASHAINLTSLTLRPV